MSHSIRETGKRRDAGVTKANIILIAAIIVVLAAVILIVNGNRDNGSKIESGKNSVVTSDEQTASTDGADMVIAKNEITENVKYYPIKVGGTNMEIFAVKAPDGTLRTAFNTCQVCNGSPKAYFKQIGDLLVCQNCGNKFSMDVVGKESEGCSPIPILEKDRTDKGTDIVISKDFISKYKTLFPSNWKTK